MIGVLFLGISVFWLEWIYLKRKKEQYITYVKVFPLLFLAIIYIGWVISLESDHVTSPHFYLDIVFNPLQNFLTLKGWRE
ncbi:hypothetical protein J2T56_000083 [Natronobacillus azotifigens]